MKTFGVVNNNLKIRLLSSSGGVFYCLAKQIIENGGVCYGAFMDDFGNVLHKRITSVSDIELLMGSKYVKSVIDSSIYSDLRKDVLDKKSILFTGTPCQIYAIYHYLQLKQLNIDNVFFVQVFCHGVPDPLYWKQYISNKAFHTPLSFRIKKPSWIKYSVNIGQRKEIYYRNPYMFLFLNNYILLESCFNCSFKGPNNYYDLAIGDFWGVQISYPQLYSKYGVSLVVMNDNIKGNYLLNVLKKDCKVVETDADVSLQYNPSFYQPPKKPIDLRAIQLLISNGYSFYKCQSYINKKRKNSFVYRLLRKVGVKK